MKLRFLSAAAVVAFLASCSGGGNPDSAPGAMPVNVSSPFTRTIELTEIYTGRFEPVEEVELRARVSGYVKSVHFKEGQKIGEGELMFQIDPRPFDAQLAAAEAGVKQAEARLKLAKSNLDRAEKLVSTNAISREEADIRRSEFAQAEADLLAAQAESRSAKLDREFADVVAPISGIASRFYVTPGNFISGGAPGSDLLTTIVPHHPIHCVFEVDERQILKFTRMYFEGKTDGRGGEQPLVKIAVSDRDEFEFEGEIDFADNQLDQSTATTRMRVLVQNENEFLTPGLFAKVKVTIGDPFEATLVREAALGFDQSKRFVWVLGEGNVVSRRYVETGPLEGELRIVESGLTPEDRVVLTGTQLLQEGMEVAPTEVPMDPGAEQEAPPEEVPSAGEEEDGDQASTTDIKLFGRKPNPTQS